MIDYYKIKPNLSSTDIILLNELQKGVDVKPIWLAQIIGISRQAIHKKLQKLQRYGLIEIVKNGKVLNLKPIISASYERQNGVPHRTNYYNTNKLRINDMSVYDKLVKWQWYALQDKSKIDILEKDDNFYFWVSYRRLSTELGISYKSVRTSIKNLIKAEMVITINKSNKIFFYLPNYKQHIIFNRAKMVDENVNQTGTISSTKRAPNYINNILNKFNILFSNNLIYTFPKRFPKHLTQQTQKEEIMQNNKKPIQDIIEQVKVDVKKKHKQKITLNITNAIAIFRSITGNGRLITPMEKNKLKRIVDFCKSNNIDYSELMQVYTDNFQEVKRNYKDNLQYLREDLTVPSISVLYDERVLKYICAKLTHVQLSEPTPVEIINQNGVSIITYNDGSRRLKL